MTELAGRGRRDHAADRILFLLAAGVPGKPEPFVCDGLGSSRWQAYAPAMRHVRACRIDIVSGARIQDRVMEKWKLPLRPAGHLRRGKTMGSVRAQGVLP